MPRQRGHRSNLCGICAAPERVRAERLLASGASIAATATKFELPYHSLRRHWLHHVSAELKASYVGGAGKTKQDLEAMAADESLGILDHYRIIRGRLYRLFDAASETGDRNGGALLAGRLHENLAGAARLTGELRTGGFITVNQQNFSLDPSYARVIGEIVRAVAPYPEARMRVIEALRKIEGPSPSPPMIEAPAVVNG